MRRVILISVLALVAGAGLWHILQYDAGYILIVAAGKTIEMRLAFALLVIFLLVLLARWIWSAITGAADLLLRGLGSASRRRALKAELRTQRGLLNFIEGNWARAQRDLLKAAKDLQKPVVQYLAAARSAHELGQEDKARDLLAKVEEIAPHQGLAVLLTRARMLFDGHNYEACLAVLLQAKTAAPAHPVVLELLKRVYVQLGDWRALELLLPELRSHKVLPDLRLQALEQQVYLALLHQAGKGIRGQEDRSALLDIEDVWRRVPKQSRKQPELVVAYTRYLILAKEYESAEPVLRATLREGWSSAVVELYGLSAPADRQAQLHQAQRWLQDHSDDADLHLALGRICLRNELWGQARDHLLRSLRLRATPPVYAELGRLFAALGEHKQSAEYFQQGLLLATHGLPCLPMPNRLLQV